VTQQSPAEGSRSLPPLSDLERGRRVYRHRQARRSVAISLLSTVVFAVVIALVLVGSPGWQVTRDTFFNPE